MNTDNQNQSSEAHENEIQPYAVVESGGKQYRVSAGDCILVNSMAVAVGEEVQLDRVLFFRNEAGCKVGTPLVAGASVRAKVVAQQKAPKIIVFKKKIRKGYTKKQGHRQSLTKLQIAEISA